MKNLLNDAEPRLLCELDGWKLLEIEKGQRIITFRWNYKRYS